MSKLVPDKHGAHAALPIAGPSEDDIRRYVEDAEARLAQQKRDAIPANTVRALRSAMRYWTYWYRAALNRAPPLINDPPEPVPAADVRLFIAQHSPVLEPIEGARRGGATHRVRIDMPADVRARMAAWAAQAGVQLEGRRRMAERSIPKGLVMDPETPSLNTILQRVALLSTLHTLRGLPPPTEEDPGLKNAIKDLVKSVRELEIPIRPAGKEALQAGDLAELLATCRQPDSSMSLEDIRDRAMLLMAFAGGGRRRAEVMALEFAHLKPVNLVVGTEALPGYMWDVFRLKGQRSDVEGKPVASLPVVGAAVPALEAWMEQLRFAGIHEGPLWRRIYTARSRKPEERVPVIGAPLKSSALAEIVKARAARMFETKGHDPDSAFALARSVAAHSLRSGFISTQLKAGVDPLAVMKMTGHKSLSSFMRYDQRSLDESPTLAVTAKLKL